MFPSLNLQNYKKYEIAATHGKNAFTSAKLLDNANDNRRRIITINEFHELSKVMEAADSYRKIKSNARVPMDGALARQYDPVISSGLYLNFSFACPLLASPFLVIPKHGEKLGRSFTFTEIRSGNEHVFDNIPQIFQGDSDCMLAIHHNFQNDKYGTPFIFSETKSIWGKIGKTRTVYNVTYAAQLVRYPIASHDDGIFCACNPHGLPIAETSSKSNPGAKRLVMSTVGSYIGFCLVSNGRGLGERTVDIKPDATQAYGAIVSV